MSRQTLQNYLSDLRSANLISTAGEGNSARKYITEKGRQYLADGR
jgi:DNA-binding PadR family transcriptional regulator